MVLLHIQKTKIQKGKCWAVKSVDKPYTRNGSAVSKKSYTRDDVKNKRCKLPLPLNKNNSNITADFENGPK